MTVQEPLAVITGAPHAGKTTLVQWLDGLGYFGLPEVARPMIERNMVTGGPLPWTSIAAFTEALWPLQVAQHETAVAKGQAAVFDRGLPDAVAFLEVFGGTPSRGLEAAVTRYRYTHVFMLSEVPRPASFSDPVRPFSAEQMRKTEEALLRVYRSLGYNVEAVPLMSVAERARRVVDALADCSR